MYSFKVKIADVVILTKVNYKETGEFFSSFKCEEKEQETIVIEKPEIEAFRKEVPYFTPEQCERGILKYKMDMVLVKYGVFPVHASALSYKGKAYVFTALSGVGKSTHSRKWKEAFGEDVIIINDDRPYLKVTGDSVLVFSHPQSGKHNLYTNTSAEAAAIGKIIRDERNYIRRMTKAEMFPFLVQQSFTLDEKEATSRIIMLIRQVLERVNAYEIHCNMDPDAAVIIKTQIEEDMAGL